MTPERLAEIRALAREMDVPVTLSVTPTISLTYSPSSAIYGSYWNSGGHYLNGGSYNYPTHTFVNDISHTGSSDGYTRFTFPVQTSGATACAWTRPFGENAYIDNGGGFVPTLFGTTITFKVWVYDYDARAGAYVTLPGEFTCLDLAARKREELLRELERVEQI